nr:RNA polymerase sigma factor [candidate division Zixibacteria bacterium]
MNQLVQQAAKGDKLAEERLFRHLHARFVFLARKRIGLDYAEDVAQEACMIIIQKLKSHEKPPNFEAWAYMILRNSIGNYLKKSMVRQNRIGAGDYVDHPDKVHVSDPDYDLRPLLIECLRKLVSIFPRYARVLNLIHHGYETDEICLRLKVKPNHLYVILNRSRKMLNRCMDKREAG